VHVASERHYAWSVPTAAISFAVSAASDRGLVRQVNEDSFVAVPPVFLVADGMGGHAFGDRASQATARTLEDRLVSERLPSVDSVLAAVRDADGVVQQIGDDAMAGSTLAGVALVGDVSGPAWMAFNIGDSRVYRFDGGLRQLSVDHSAVQELVDDGVIQPHEASTHPERNVVTRAIGVGDESAPDVWLLPFGGDECFLICSDGLTKEIDDASIAEILALPDDTASPADRLISAALAAGGIDNVTAVVVRISVLPAGTGEPVAVPAHLEETLPRP
jgi:serine/threonine protein phosphatase PrpC